MKGNMFIFCSKRWLLEPLNGIFFEYAKYFSNLLTKILQKRASCTSALRRWGVSGNKKVVEETFIGTISVSSSPNYARKAKVPGSSLADSYVQR